MAWVTFAASRFTGATLIPGHVPIKALVCWLLPIHLTWFEWKSKIAFRNDSLKLFGISFTFCKYVILCVYMYLNMNVCLLAVCKLFPLDRSKGIIIFSNLLLLRHSGCIWEWGVTMVTVSPEQGNELITMVLWEINALSKAQQQSWSVKLHHFNIKYTCVHA